MFFNLSQLGFFITVGILLNLSFADIAYAEDCEALNVVGSTNTTIQKTVSPFSTLSTNNWNTDFNVPNDRSFNSYEATLIPKNNANYNVELNLKYSDRNSSRSYKKDNVVIKVDQPLRMIGIPRSPQNPFQVNVFVGGLNAIGNTYTVSVEACI